VNIKDKDLIFMSIFPGDAGYEYNRLRKESINIRIYKLEKGYKRVSK